MPVLDDIAKRTPAAITANRRAFPPIPENVATPIMTARATTVSKIYPLLIPARDAVI
jgi:hypothetical protein